MSDYRHITPEQIAAIQGLFAEGLTCRAIAHIVGISETSCYRWRTGTSRAAKLGNGICRAPGCSNPVTGHDRTTCSDACRKASRMFTLHSTRATAGRRVFGQPVLVEHPNHEPGDRLSRALLEHGPPKHTEVDENRCIGLPVLIRTASGSICRLTPSYVPQASLLGACDE